MKHPVAVPPLLLAGMLGAILAGAFPDASAQTMSIEPLCPTERVAAAGWFPTPFAKEPKTRDSFNG